jgi:hypothetical protein
VVRPVVVVLVARALRFKVLRQLKRGFSVQIDHVVNVSGNANNGANAGTFIVNANNDASNRNRNIGTHLAENNKRTSPVRRGEYVNPIALGSESEQRGCTQQ